MATYRITVKQLVPDEQLSDPDDRAKSPAGLYFYEADGIRHALDQFHAVVPIGCLDDFEIDAAKLDKDGDDELSPQELEQDWRNEVANGDTKLGLAEWIEHQKEMNGIPLARHARDRVMRKLKLVFSEEKSQVRRIEIEIELEDYSEAAQAAIKAYQDSKYDTQLEEAEADTTEYRTEVAYYNEAGEYVVLLPWD